MNESPARPASSGGFREALALSAGIMEPRTASNYFTLQTIRDLSELESLREVWKSWQKKLEILISISFPTWSGREARAVDPMSSC